MKAKLEEFEVVEKETMTNDKIREMSQQDLLKLKDSLARDRINLMDIKFDFLSQGFHSGAIKELHSCL